MQSFIYRHPLIYRLAIRLSYGRHFKDRYRALCTLIPEKASVTELCMGDAYLYAACLKKKKVDYRCADLNSAFVESARRRGIDAVVMNVAAGAIPPADYVIMQGSLYHFIPGTETVIRNMLAACRRGVIISESVSNLSNSSSPLKAWLGEWLSRSSGGQSKVKFTAGSLREALKPFEAQTELWQEAGGGKDIIIVLRKDRTASSAS